MNLSWSAILATCVLAFAAIPCAVDGQTVTKKKITLKALTKDVTTDLYLPGGSGKRPAAMLLYGSHGLTAPWGADIEGLANAIAEAGFVVAIPHYFEATGVEPGIAAITLIPQNLDAWKKAVAELYSELAEVDEVDANDMNIVGLSLGGHLALHHGLHPGGGPKVRRIVDFFGPVDNFGQIENLGLSGTFADLPPVQIHHNDKDKLVPLAESKALIKKLEQAGKAQGADYESFWYDSDGHALKPIDLKKAMKETVRFLKKPQP